MRDSDLNPGLGEIGRQLWELLKAASSEGLESATTTRPEPERLESPQTERFIVKRSQPAQAHETVQEPIPVTRRSSASRRRREIRRMLSDKKSLQNAILVSEILGQPKSLRRDESL